MLTFVYRIRGKSLVDKVYEALLKIASFQVVMMDWVAKLFGLDESFHNASGLGGGIIMVSPTILHTLLSRLTDHCS